MKWDFPVAVNNDWLSEEKLNAVKFALTSKFCISTGIPLWQSQIINCESWTSPKDAKNLPKTQSYLKHKTKCSPLGENCIAEMELWWPRSSNHSVGVSVSIFHTRMRGSTPSSPAAIHIRFGEIAKVERVRFRSFHVRCWTCKFDCQLKRTTNAPAKYVAKPRSSKTSGQQLFLFTPRTCSTSNGLTYANTFPARVKY